MAATAYIGTPVRGKVTDAPVATTSPTTAPTSSGLAQLASKLKAQTNPTTHDATYFGQYGSSGQYAYVGPDGQPYVGAKSDFYTNPANGYTSPILSKAKAVTYASLGINAPTVVTESTYSGSGADSAATNDTNYKNAVGQDASTGGATLVVGSNSISNLAAGAYSGAIGAASPSTAATQPPSAVIATGLSGDSTLAPIVPPTPVSIASVTGTGDAVASQGAVGPGSTAATDSSPAGVAQQLVSAGLGGSSTTGVDGSGSIASMVPVASDSGTATTSGPPVTLIVVCLLIVAGIVGFFLYERHKHTKAA